MKKHQRLLDKGKIEKLVLSLGFHRINQSRSHREASHRSRLLGEKCRTHALPQVSSPAPVCRLWRHRSRLQDRHRLPPQAIRHVPDRSRCQRHRRPAMRPSQRPFLKTTGRLAAPHDSTFKSRTQSPVCRSTTTSFATWSQTGNSKPESGRMQRKCERLARLCNAFRMLPPPKLRMGRFR